jgi:hypothetical protein
LHFAACDCPVFLPIWTVNIEAHQKDSFVLPRLYLVSVHYLGIDHQTDGAFTIDPDGIGIRFADRRTLLQRERANLYLVVIAKT